MEANIETIILKNLMYNPEYMTRVIPFLKNEYFLNPIDKLLFHQLHAFIDKYKKTPSKDAVVIGLTNARNIKEEDLKAALGFLDDIEKSQNNLPDLPWAIDATEKFCRDRALYNAIMESISIIDGKEKTKDKGSIPEILTKALGVSFDTKIGHDFLNDIEKRYEYYHETCSRIPFDIDILNTITKGGLKPKTLNVILGGIHAGKSLIMCHMAAANLAMGKNVLYVTLEMSEEEVAKRIDVNLLNVTFDDLDEMPKETYLKKAEAMRTAVKGKLLIKEYPTSAANANHIRHLLAELRLKLGFVPDVIYVDYLNIMSSSRVAMDNNHGLYLYVKSIAEEVRGLAIEFDVPIVSATQLNRTGFVSTDPGMDAAAESFGLPATADLLLAAIVTPELQDLNQILIKQLKNRYAGTANKPKFVIGVNCGKQKLINLNDSAQDNIITEKLEQPPASSPAIQRSSGYAAKFFGKSDKPNQNFQIKV